MNQERVSSKQTEQEFPPISDYAYISDCHSAALISRAASIDWCCMPRLDASSCFARILDWHTGGYCRIFPSTSHESSRRYLENTLVLETSFACDRGKVRLLDCLTIRQGGRHAPHNQLLRILEGVEGVVECCVEFFPRFDYGAIKPWVRLMPSGQFIVLGGNHGIVVTTNMELTSPDRHSCVGSCTVRAGQRLYLSITHRPPNELDQHVEAPPSTQELDRRLDETIQWWRAWAAKGSYQGRLGDQARRSAIVLKGLQNAPTGAIAAAPTTSLPESVGGNRNWDYRFSWIRDSTFTVRSLAAMGWVKEADGFRRFIQRSAAGSAEQIQIMYGVNGERRLFEIKLDELSGYRNSRPVRIGNAAAAQRQHDMYGELLDLAWSWHKAGNSPNEDYWDFIYSTVNQAIKEWRKPDSGIWEVRGGPRHFVYSKAMCWVALDRAIKLAESTAHPAPFDEWHKVRDQIRQTVDEQGYDDKRGVFIQAFGYPILDASLLLLPIYGFVEYADERMIRTTQAIAHELNENGLIRRYPAGTDKLIGKEGVFIACTFWLVENLVAQGDIDGARAFFDRAWGTANDLGLLAEEYDPEDNQMLGNFPQGLTHLSHIAAVVALNKAGANHETVHSSTASPKEK